MQVGGIVKGIFSCDGFKFLRYQNIDETEQLSIFVPLL